MDKELIESLKNINIDLNSETAMQIVDMYITYKYVNMIIISIFLVLMTIAARAVWREYIKES